MITSVERLVEERSVSDQPVSAAPGAHAASRLATLRVRSGSAPRSIPVPGPFATVGSDPGNDVVIEGPGMAPRHARLDLRGGVWTLLDFGADGGSWVDGDAVDGDAVLAPGSTVRLGEVLLAFAPEDSWHDSAARESEWTRSIGSLLILPNRRQPWWPRVVFLLAVCALVAIAFLILRTI